jgi:hypothetical protein
MGGSGRLQCRYERPAGHPRAGVGIEILPLGLEQDRPNGQREVRTGPDGVARISLPPGEYYIGRGRRYGPPAWVRRFVVAGGVTEVVLAE